jgi:hypothetical protein
MRCYTMLFSRNSLTFQRNILPPALRSKIELNKQPARSEHQAELWLCLAGCLLQTVCSSEMLVNFHEITRRHVPEEHNILELTLYTPDIKIRGLLTGKQIRVKLFHWTP